MVFFGDPPKPVKAPKSPGYPSVLGLPRLHRAVRTGLSAASFVLFVHCGPVNGAVEGPESAQTPTVTTSDVPDAVRQAPPSATWIRAGGIRVIFAPNESSLDEGRRRLLLDVARSVRARDDIVVLAIDVHHHYGPGEENQNDIARLRGQTIMNVLVNEGGLSSQRLWVRFVENDDQEFHERTAGAVRPANWNHAYVDFMMLLERDPHEEDIESPHS